jgi:hypothetical protein
MAEQQAAVLLARDAPADLEAHEDPFDALRRAPATSHTASTIPW